MEFCCWRLLKFIVARDNNILEVTECSFMAGSCHIYLWPEATRFTNSQNPYKRGKLFLTIKIALMDAPIMMREGGEGQGKI